jgi:hypothetical protein
MINFVIVCLLTIVIVHSFTINKLRIDLYRHLDNECCSGHAEKKQ